MHWSRGQALLIAGLVAAYAAFVAWYHAPYAGGSDSSGYLNSAQLILQGRVSTPPRLPDGLPPGLLRMDTFIPLGFRPDVTGREMVPTYPVGLPLHLVAIGWFTGLESASRILAVATALAFLALLYFISREFGVRPAWSLGVAALGALSPLTLMFALQPMSDLLAAVWAVATILCARRAARGSGWALGAGFALAVAVLVRPTNLLCALPALLALPVRPRAWLAFGLGGLPGALFQAWYNHALYGAYFTTGYGGDVDVLFSWQHVAPSLWHYALWAPVVASPLAAAAFALPWAGVPRRDQLVLGAWAGILFGFYAAYAYTNDDWWYMRFLLPALPALGIAAALVLQSARLPSWFLASRLLPPGTPAGEVARGRVLQIPVAILALVLATGWMLHWSRRFHVADTELDERGYPLTARWVNQSLPADGVVLGQQVSGALLHYTSRPFLIPDWFTAEECARLETWLAQNHRSLYAALYPHEEAAVWRQFPGRWEKLARFRHAIIWHRVERGEFPAPPPR
jgi:hypothetical protein